MPPFSGERASELVYGRFGCVVRGCVDAAVADVPAHAGDEDDAAGVAGLVHRVCNSARDEECPCDVDVEDFAEDVGVVVACVAFAGNGGAGDKAADWMARFYGIEDMCDGCFILDVKLVVGCLGPICMCCFLN